MPGGVDRQAGHPAIAVQPALPFVVADADPAGGGREVVMDQFVHQWELGLQMRQMEARSSREAWTRPRPRTAAIGRYGCARERFRTGPAIACNCIHVSAVLHPAASRC